MTWGELKKKAEEAGVKDEYKILYMEIESSAGDSLEFDIDDLGRDFRVYSVYN